VLAGGRYDGLVEQLGGSATPAIGWAAGIERLVLLMQEAGVAVPDTAPHAYLCWLGDAERDAALQLAEQLREALPQLRLTLNAGGGKLAAQLKRADRCGARLALILGEAENARQSVQVKSLERMALAGSSQTECSWADLPARLAGVLQP
jgi:histidyl-tRNA synthetase